MKTDFLVITTLVLFAYPSLASKVEDDIKPLIDANVDLDSMFAKSPSASQYNSGLFLKESRDHMKYVARCAESMGGSKCEDEVLSEILQNKPASKRCCIQMLVFGKECHTEVNRVLLATYYLKPFASKARLRIPKVWNRCCSSIGVCDELY
ncbi:unnamed protein product [Arabis nemorensis]|uniref:Prolamin-like domain-containing protein n=1 Tax=Arabis nemorensis TaxID=586526 RepID=A0A565B4R6_9BRAS|nr:unnamed protein product [Arabis nemorensis]